MVLLGSRATVKTSFTTPFACTTLGARRQPTRSPHMPTSHAGRRGDRVADTPATRTTAPPRTTLCTTAFCMVDRTSRSPVGPADPSHHSFLLAALSADPFDAYPRADFTPTREAAARPGRVTNPLNGGT